MIQASKAKVFKDLLNSNELQFAMEAHNGLSAKIAENAGFKIIWASGFSISTSLGLRDTNEVSWTQLADIVENMVSVTSVPVFVDGDSGHGNFNNVRLLTKKLSSIGAAAICIEDKLFPKTNSLVNDTKQELVSIEEFCGKIKAAKDSSIEDNFSVIARVESLIAGTGMSDALKRAEAYHKAGADGIFIHSKKLDASEIIEFTKEWNNRCPTIIVPTNYFNTPTQTFEEIKISIILWGSHNFRASIKAMEKVSRKIFQDRSVINIQNDICSIEEIFQLLNYDELKKAEKKYLELVEDS